MSTVTQTGQPVVVLIGTGTGGIAAAVNLKHRMGFNNFVVFEKSPGGIGGTWRHQKYPGCACDIPSHFYSFSFELNPDWSCEYAPRQELQAYMTRVCDKYDILSHVRFSHEVLSMSWDDTDKVWDIKYQILEMPAGAMVEEEGQWEGNFKRKPISQGTFRANLVLNTSGVFTKPYIPDYPGVAFFKGDVLHTCYWNDTVSLEGKRVAIVHGTEFHPGHPGDCPYCG